MAELAHAYVSIRASTGGMKGDVRKALTGIEADAGKTGQSMGQKLSSGMGNVLKKTAVGVGVASGAALAAGLTKGIGRLTGIENAEASLRGLGHSASNVEGIMDNALASVKGTSYGLEEAATIAASAVAAGIKPGQELERTLKLTGDAAAIAGTDLQSMGSIINKVATSDMMQMDVANQLMDAGIPILQMVGAEMGVTAEEARKMASDGKVSFETFQNALESGLGGAAQKSGETLQGALANLGAAMGRLGEAALKPFMQDGKDLIGMLTEWVNTMTEQVGPVVERMADWLVNSLIPALQNTVRWIIDNKDMLTTLAVMVSTGVAAWFAYQKALVVVTAAKKAYAAATLIADKGMKGLNATMKANLIGIIVVAIIALIAGLTWFFTQTETGKAIWESFTNALSVGWEWVKNAFASAWGVIQPILSGIWTAIQFVGAVFATVILGLVLAGWNMFAAILGAVWNGIIKPVWDAFAAVMTWLWNTILRPIWDGMKIAFQALGAFFRWVWDAVIQPMWTAFGAGVQLVWNTVIRPAWDAMKVALGAVGSFFQMVWNTVIKPVWDALGAGIRWVVDNVILPAWDVLKSALDSVGSFFSTVVEGIRKTWDAMKGHVAKPINFVIETVWNNGLLEAWDTIAGFLPGLPSAEGARLSPVEFAEGGHVPFVSGSKRGVDSVNAVLMPDEHVLDVNDVRSFGGHGNVYAIRHFLEQGRPFMFDGSGGIAGLPRHPDHSAGDLAGAAPDLLIPRFADGGRVRRAIDRDDNVRPAWMDQLVKGHEYAQRIAPAPYVLGGSSGGQPGGPTDCSGYMGEIADAITDGPVGQRSWATMTFPDRQAGMWQPGLGPGFSVGIMHGGPAGGHTAGTLSAVDHFGATNVESGGGTGQGATYGGLAVGADHPQFTDHHHLKIGADGAFESGGGPSRASQMSLIRQKVQEILDKALDPIKGAMGAAIGTPPPEWLGIPPVVLDESKTAAVDTAFDFIENLGDKLRSAYDLAKGVTSFIGTTVTGLFRDQGGYIPTGQSVVTNETGRPEAVFNWKQVDRIASILNSVRDMDHLWEVLGEFGNLASTGQFTESFQNATGVAEDDELVESIINLRESVLEGLDTLNSDMTKVLQDAGTKAATGYASEAADMFGFKGVYDAINSVVNRPAQDAAASATTSAPATATTTATKTPRAEAVPMAGDPNVRFESTEVALDTHMPDFDGGGSPGSGPVVDQVKEEIGRAHV